MKILKATCLALLMAPLCAQATLSMGGPASQITFNVRPDKINEFVDNMNRGNMFDLGSYNGSQTFMRHPVHTQQVWNYSLYPQTIDLTFDNDGVVVVKLHAVFWDNVAARDGFAAILGSTIIFEMVADIHLLHPFVIKTVDGRDLLNLCWDRVSEVKNGKVFKKLVGDIEFKKTINKNLMDILKEQDCMEMGVVTLPFIPEELKARNPEILHNEHGITVRYFTKHFEQKASKVPTLFPILKRP